MKKSLFLTSAIMTAVLAVGLSTSTYAWYSTTVGEAASSTATISAAVNNIQAEYYIEAPVLKKVVNGGSAWVDVAATATSTAQNSAKETYDLSHTYTISDKMLGSKYGNANAPTAEAEGDAHWFTAVNVNKVVTLDSTSEGILALRYTYTLPAISATDEVLKTQYVVNVDFTITSGAPYLYTVQSTDQVDPNGAGTAIGTGYHVYHELSTTARTYYITFWIDGTNIGDDGSKVDLKDKTADISLTVGVTPESNKNATKVA